MEELHLDPMAEATAPGVSALFSRLLGEGYPEELRRTWVARKAEGQVVGSISPHSEARRVGDRLDVRRGGANLIAHLPRARELWA